MYIGNEIFLDWENAYAFENHIYFTDMDNNEVYVYDLEEKKCSFLTAFPEEKKEKRLFGAVTVIEDTVYLFPFMSDKIYEIDRTAEKISIYAVETPGSEYKSEKTGCFLNAHRRENKIFLTGNYPSIVEFDIKTKELVYWDSPMYKEEHLYFETEVEHGVIKKSMMLADKIYLPMCKHNAVIVFDIETHIFTRTILKSRAEGFSAVCFDGQYFWLTSRVGGWIVRWSDKDNSIVEYEVLSENMRERRGCFNDCIFWNREVWLIPGSQGTLVKVNPANGTQEKIADEYAWMSALVLSDTEILLQTYQKHSMLLWNATSGNIMEQQIIMPDERKQIFRLDHMQMLVQQGKQLWENSIYMLRNWLNCVRKR